jgi:hypothetical protein
VVPVVKIRIIVARMRARGAPWIWHSCMDVVLLGGLMLSLLRYRSMKKLIVQKTVDKAALIH